jgi:hypothetical protein
VQGNDRPVCVRGHPSADSRADDMVSDRWLRVALRSCAVLIALVAVIDPSMITSRRSRPLISLVAMDSLRDRVVLEEARNALRERFTVIDAPLSGASGTVLIGARVPDDAQALASPVVVVTPSKRAAAVVIRRIEAPSRALLQSRVTVQVSLAVTGVARAAAARDVIVELTRPSSSGDAGDEALVLSRERVALRADSVLRVPLTFVPSRAEATVLRVRATIDGSADTARSDFAVDVRAVQWSVLFFDRRPSWMSTFVRRAIERDPRFVVTSRVVTSPNISRETGRAPESLDALAASSRFDAVVIGAPDALTTRDVGGIDLLLRSRGASVLLLADNPSAGPADRLLDFGGWRATQRGVASALVPITIVGTPTAGSEPLRLLGRSVGVPTRLPLNAEPLAMLARDTSALAQRRAIETVIWRVPMGMGSLVVSGAFDAWRYRDSAQSTFDATWRDLIERAASDRPAVVDVQLSRTLIQPREQVSVTIGAPLVPTDASAQVSLYALARGGVEQKVHEVAVASSGTDGALIGGFRAPRAPGAYVVRVVRGVDSATAALVVANGVARDAGANRDVLDAWVQSRQGRRVDRTAVGTLPTVVNALITNPARLTTWHPMRSAWWIVPFALALGAEWWLRRRRGEA